MTILNTDINRVYETPSDTNAAPVASGTKIYQGALVGRTINGYGRALQAGDIAIGFAKDNTDNTNGDNGDRIAELKARGKVSLPISGLVTSDFGRKVYASDDNTFTLSETDNSFFGFVVRVEKDGQGIIAFDFLYTEITTQSNEPQTTPEP